MVYSMDSPPEKVELGLSVVRGDNVAVVGEGGEEGEEDVRAEPVGAIVQNVT